MTYDLTVIGSGPGGYVAAIKAAELGLKVACVEKEKVLGGTCLNVGCIPSKALLNSSEHFHYAQHGFEKHGISTGSVKINISKMMKRKEGVVKELNQGIEGLFKKNKIEWVSGSGSLVTGKNGTEVVVKSGNGKKKTLATRYTLLATGSTPIELPFLPFDGQNVISSTEALELTKIPKSLLVIGAGAIGLELGSVWSRLGTEVEVVEFLPQIAAGFDPDVSKALQKLFEAQGLKFHLSTEVKSAEVLKSKVKLAAMQEGKEKFFEAEKVLVAVGRKPFTDGLGLEEAGIEVTAKGRISVDKNWQTSVDGVYAIGDVIDGPMLAHKAEAEGVAIAERLAGQVGSVNYKLIPNVIYTYPECASVGRTEQQCKDEGIEVKAGKFPFQFNGRAKAVDQTDGFVKILSCKKTDRIVGATIISSNASEIIGEVVTAMEFGSSAEDLARTIHAHPTMSEVIKEASHLATNH
jgi:dihydrolipoamide dehydrogenase